MASKKQVEANRLNSQESTGPRSVEGKAVFPQNALKSGIYSKSQIISGESAVDLECLRDEYYHHFHPANPAERMLVDTLIDSEWLLRRFRAVDAPCTGDNPQGPTFLSRSYSNGVKRLDRLQSRINATQRTYRNALKDLQRLRAVSPRPQPPHPRALGARIEPIV